MNIVIFIIIVWVILVMIDNCLVFVKYIDEINGFVCMVFINYSEIECVLNYLCGGKVDVCFWLFKFLEMWIENLYFFVLNICDCVEVIVNKIDLIDDFWEFEKDVGVVDVVIKGVCDVYDVWINFVGFDDDFLDDSFEVEVFCRVEELFIDVFC